MLFKTRGTCGLERIFLGAAANHGERLVDALSLGVVGNGCAGAVISAMRLSKSQVLVVGVIADRT